MDKNVQTRIVPYRSMLFCKVNNILYIVTVKFAWYISISICIYVCIVYACLLFVDHFDLVILKVASKPKKCGHQGLTYNFHTPVHMLCSAFTVTEAYLIK